MKKNDMMGAAPVRMATDMDGGALAGWRWPNAQKPPLLFCHATGFCASVYKQMLQALSADFDIYALDLRGHGRTELAADPDQLQSWNIYARDISQFLNAHKRTNWILAGHSMGAVTATMAARGRNDIDALKLIEPVAMPPLLAYAAKLPIWPYCARRLPLVQQAARRRSHWPDRAAAQSSYARKKLFAGWSEGVLSDYLEDGLCEDGEGVSLACAPRWEAATFAAQANHFWKAVADAPAAVSVLAADHPSTTTGSVARNRFSRFGASVALVGDVSHLAPMENPDLVAKFVLNARYDA